MEAARRGPGDTMGSEMYGDLQRDVMEKGPMAIMFQMYNSAGVSPTVKNWTWNGFRVWYGAAGK